MLRTELCKSNCLLKARSSCFLDRGLLCSPGWPQNYDPLECWDYSYELVGTAELIHFYSLLMYEQSIIIMHSSARRKDALTPATTQTHPENVTLVQEARHQSSHARAHREETDWQLPGCGGGGRSQCSQGMGMVRLLWNKVQVTTV